MTRPRATSQDRPRVVDAGDPAALQAAIEALRADQLVAIPTETVYGLACGCTEAALARLLVAKGRPPDKGITLLVDGLAQAATVGALPAAAVRLARRHWPGPLTLVVPLGVGVELPGLITGGGPNVGLRVPDVPVARALASALGPLPLTSANRSGEAEARTAAEVLAVLGGSVELILDGGPSPGGVPSTVVAFDSGDPGRPWRIARQGALSEDEISMALGA
ncbi:MAG: L-threonylcarbamoyladenylate synthase [Candidatus Limnocylindrales bacterium]